MNTAQEEQVEIAIFPNNDIEGYYKSLTVNLNRFRFTLHSKLYLERYMEMAKTDLEKGYNPTLSVGALGRWDSLKYLVTIWNDSSSISCWIYPRKGLGRTKCHFKFEGVLDDQNVMNKLCHSIAEYIKLGNCPFDEDECRKFVEKDAREIITNGERVMWWKCLPKEWRLAFKKMYGIDKAEEEVDKLKNILEEVVLDIPENISLSSLIGCRNLTYLRRISLYNPDHSNLDGIENLNGLTEIFYSNPSSSFKIVIDEMKKKWEENKQYVPHFEPLRNK